MMSTTLKFGVIATALVAFAICTNSATAQGEARSRRNRQTAEVSDADAEAGRANTANAEGSSDEKPERPAPNAMRVPELTPDMLRVLKNWEVATAKIKRLEVKHSRRVYDSTFSVEKISEGTLVFEAPCKGRIAIRGIEPPAGAKSNRKDPTSGKQYSLDADSSEQWICDGKFIWQINEGDKTIEEVPLPDNMQGPNIMDGPMPFLFGMPVDQARERYALEFNKLKPKNRPKNEIWLDVKPRLAKDAANWSSASVILDDETYLPLFVKMKDPSENLETVYEFKDVKVNGTVLPWSRDVFKPPRSGYNYHRNNIAQPNSGCPSLIGLSAKRAASVLEQAGYQVTWKRGEPARNENLIYVVYEQEPAPKSPLPKGEKVTLKVYDKVIERQNGRPIGDAPKEGAAAERE